MGYSRKERIRLYGSPTFDYSPVLSANGVYAISFPENSEAGKYLPFDHFVIQNNSSSNIKVTIRDSEYYVFAGTSREEQNIHFNELLLTELSGSATSSGEIRVEVSRSGMNADKKALEDAVVSPLKKIASIISGGIF